MSPQSIFKLNLKYVHVTHLRVLQADVASAKLEISNITQGSHWRIEIHTHGTPAGAPSDCHRCENWNSKCPPKSFCTASSLLVAALWSHSVAARCSALQRVAGRCRALQRVAVCCHVMQWEIQNVPQRAFARLPVLRTLIPLCSQRSLFTYARLSNGSYWEVIFVGLFYKAFALWSHPAHTTFPDTISGSLKSLL